MRWPSSNKWSPIGLDLGAHTFKAVQLRRHANDWDVGATVSLPRLTPGVPVTAAEIERLQGVLDRRGFQGRDVTVAVPAASLLTAVLELPAKAPGVPLPQLAELEFGRVHKVDAAQLVMSSWELPASVRASKATFMLAVGTKTEALESHLDVVESGRLNVVAVDEPYSATARGCRHAGQLGRGLTAVVDLGWLAATLTILRGETVVYTRKLTDAGLAGAFSEARDAGFTDADEVRHVLWDIGFDPESNPATDEAGLLDLLGSHLTTMLKEVGQAFGYTGHQYPDSTLDKILLTGGGALIRGLERRMQQALGHPTQAATLDRPAPVSPAMMTALGLALHDVEAP